MTAGIHIVTKRRAGKPVRHYVYAWRGGPQIAVKEGGEKPRITTELADLAAEKRRERPAGGATTIAALIDRYTDPACAEWKRLSASTRANYATWHARIVDEFGSASLRVFWDRRVRGDVLEWRDRWSDQPRSADAAVTTFSALLSWAVDRGFLPTNVLLGVDRLYDANRSDIIWQAHHFEAFEKEASVEVMEAVELAAATGLRRGDLVQLPWSAVGDHAIVWRTSKSKRKNVVNIPLLPEARAVMARIKARHATEMAQRKPERRVPLPDTILSNSFWKPWTASGLGSRFNDAKQASGIEVNLHDVRGTFATWLMLNNVTDDQIADIIGWSTKEVAHIRMKYVSQTRVVISIGERLSGTPRALE